MSCSQFPFPEKSSRWSVPCDWVVVGGLTLNSLAILSFCLLCPRWKSPCSDWFPSKIFWMQRGGRGHYSGSKDWKMTKMTVNWVQHSHNMFEERAKMLSPEEEDEARLLLRTFDCTCTPPSGIILTRPLCQLYRVTAGTEEASLVHLLPVKKHALCHWQDEKREALMFQVFTSAYRRFWIWVVHLCHPFWCCRVCSST